MAGNKYDKFSFSGLAPREGEGIGNMIAHFDGSVFEGSNEYSCGWIYEKPRSVPGWTEWDQVIHAPHTHKYPEIFLHLGTDPENPMDLGAEVVFHMGPEMEEHIITRSTLVYILYFRLIPAGGFLGAQWTLSPVCQSSISCFRG